MFITGRKTICTLLILITAFTSGCFERKKNNPFEPGAPSSVTLRIIAFDQRVELSWNRPDLYGFSGFNLYRSETGETASFTIIAAGISPNQSSYTDTDIENGKRYYYYLTVTSLDIESSPTPVVSAAPGRGFNWAVDYSGYEVVKLTYDLQTVLFRLSTSSRPQDLVIGEASGTGLILLPDQGIIRQISLSDGQGLNLIESIRYPYRAEYESGAGIFWLIDSSGSLYKIDELSLNTEIVYNSLEHPVSLTLSDQNQAVYLADPGSRSFIILSKSGAVLEKIEQIGGSSLISPQKMIFDQANQRYWLLESTANMAYIYTRRVDESEYRRIDISHRVSDMELSHLTDSIYLSGLSGDNSTVLQLYPDGSRQIALSGLYNPLDIGINRYDATLLVVESGSGLLWHYSPVGQLIGYYPGLYIPHKVRIE